MCPIFKHFPTSVSPGHFVCCIFRKKKFKSFQRWITFDTAREYCKVWKLWSISPQL